jgi:hypothetical protein
MKTLALIFAAALTIGNTLALAQEPAASGTQHQHSDHMEGMQMGAEDDAATASLHMMHAASGTSVEPASTPAYMYMKRWKDWDLMAHGVVFLTGNFQGGPRGREKFESVNWAMFMEHHKLGRGTLELHQMLSAEPATAPRGGFPELFQTGESFRGLPLVDQQHPHDLIGELSATYTLPIGEHASWQLYGGPAGEPALGPVTYVHRTSASEIPTAPLGHHMEDSTHISYGVVTTGFTYRKWKIEASAFNGREPDEYRYNFDFAPLDSWSARINYSPSRNWTSQYSFGVLKHPEALEATNIQRQTASVTYNRPLNSGNWATTFLWGQNFKTAADTRRNAFLVESVLNFLQKNYAYARMEVVDKDELVGTFIPPDQNFRIGAYTFGGVRDLVQNSKIQIGLGADFTVYSKPASLDTAYGSTPVGAKVFLRFRPGKSQAHMH